VECVPKWEMQHPSARLQCGWPERIPDFLTSGSRQAQASRLAATPAGTDLPSTTVHAHHPTHTQHNRVLPSTILVHHSQSHTPRLHTAASILLPSPPPGRGRATIDKLSKSAAPRASRSSQPITLSVHVHPIAPSITVRIPIPLPTRARPFSQAQALARICNESCPVVVAAVETELRAALPLPLQRSLPVAPLSHRALLACLPDCLPSPVIH
jgi:hypothetical protein